MVQVIKANGESQQFSDQKVKYSIKRAGISEDLQDQVLAHVKSKLYEDIPTSEIYHHITEFLTTADKPYEKARYSLKQAIMDLGPTGYPFEDFVAEIFKALGYTTQTRVIMQGTCITHEIDVLAEKDGKKSIIEAKFHNSSGTRSDVHVPMYMKSRFEDLKVRNDIAEVMIVTNTKATLDAITYGACIGMKIISWGLPESESLRDLVEKYNLHPITALTTLSQSQKQMLLDKSIVVCKDLLENQEHLQVLGLPEEKKQAVIAELTFICQSNTVSSASLTRS